ncbi:hypothetical protein Lser_V15G34819 [Lactuca serriola]
MEEGDFGRSQPASDALSKGLEERNRCPTTSVRQWLEELAKFLEKM